MGQARRVRELDDTGSLLIGQVEAERVQAHFTAGITPLPLAFFDAHRRAGPGRADPEAVQGSQRAQIMKHSTVMLHPQAIGRRCVS